MEISDNLFLKLFKSLIHNSVEMYSNVRFNLEWNNSTHFKNISDIQYSGNTSALFLHAFMDSFSIKLH